MAEYGVHGLNKKEKKEKVLREMDNSVVVAGEGSCEEAEKGKGE